MIYLCFTIRLLFVILYDSYIYIYAYVCGYKTIFQLESIYKTTVPSTLALAPPKNMESGISISIVLHALVVAMVSIDTAEPSREKVLVELPFFFRTVHAPSKEHMRIDGRGQTTLWRSSSVRSSTCNWTKISSADGAAHSFISFEPRQICCVGSDKLMARTPQKSNAGTLRKLTGSGAGVISRSKVVVEGCFLLIF